MHNDNIIEIPVSLAGRKYPVLATPEEVEYIHLINEQLQAEFDDLKARYSNKLNNQDILAMLLLTYAKNLYDEKAKQDLSPVQQKVASIEQLLEQVSLK